MMHDLRDSGKWEEDADGIMFLYRDEVYDKDTEFPHLGEINTEKNRGGKRGVAQVYADVTTNRFVDLETRTVAI
jgi:replicative DNA helicase